MKKIAITGASGFVGKMLASKLIDEGFDVVQLDSHAWDITEKAPPHIVDRLKKTEMAFHLAAYIPSDHSNLDEIKKCNDVNGVGTFNTLALANEAGVKNFVHVSSANLLQSDGSKSVDNDSPYDCSRAMPYFSSKVLAEMYVKSFHTPHMSKLIVRPSSLYSMSKPCSIVRYISKCITQGDNIELYNNGVFAADYFLAEDLVKILNYIAKTPNIIEMVITEEVSKSGRNTAAVLNVGSGKATRHLDIAKKACAIKQLDSWKVIKFKRKEEVRKFGFGAVKESQLLKNAGLNPVHILEQNHLSNLLG